MACLRLARRNVVRTSYGTHGVGHWTWQRTSLVHRYRTSRCLRQTSLGHPWAIRALCGPFGHWLMKIRRIAFGSIRVLIVRPISWWRLLDCVLIIGNSFFIGNWIPLVICTSIGDWRKWRIFSRDEVTVSKTKKQIYDQFKDCYRNQFVITRSISAAVNNRSPDAVGLFFPQRPTNSRNCCDFLWGNCANDQICNIRREPENRFLFHRINSNKWRELF